MDAKTIQADYEQLETIANRFGQLAEDNDTLRAIIVKDVDALKPDGWEGKGSQAFFKEMDSVVFPAAERLTTALAEAQNVTSQIIHIIREAEEEAARPFQGDYAGEGTDGSKGGRCKNSWWRSSK